MKLLFDQNLSRYLVTEFQSDFPGSRHVTPLGLAGASDEDIWNFARLEGYAIVSKDADFHHLSFRYGAPPKAIWLRLGNCSTKEVAACLSRNRSALKAFLDDADSALLVITANPDEIDLVTSIAPVGIR